MQHSLESVLRKQVDRDIYKEKYVCHGFIHPKTGG